MQVSFYLVAQAMLVARMKEQLDQAYLEAQKEAKQKYMRSLTMIREEYIPLYAVLQQEIDLFWDDVKEEVGIEDERFYSVLEDGAVVRTTGLCGELWEL